MFYLSSVYSVHAHSNSEEHIKLRQKRYEYAVKRLAEFMNEGVMVFSPIAHCHEASVNYDLPKHFEFWKKYDEHMIDLSEGVFVLMMPHYKESTGVSYEVQYAESLGKPVVYLDCSDYKED